MSQKKKKSNDLRNEVIDIISNLIVEFIFKMMKHENLALQKKWRGMTIKINQALTRLEKNET